jgi:hypothetical protein
MKTPKGTMWVMHHLFEPDQDDKDKLILELLGTIGTHPNYQHNTSSLNFEIHKGYAGLPNMMSRTKTKPYPSSRKDYNLR